MINIYSEKEIALLKKSGAILSATLHEVADFVRPGVSALTLNDLAEKKIRQAGGAPAFLGYGERGDRPYPASLCVSINDELVHCVPYRDKIIREGDIVSLDLGVALHGMITDMAVTVGAGEIATVARELITVSANCLERAIDAVKAGATTGDIGYAVERAAESSGFSIIRDLVGHGVGHNLHEDPRVPNFGKPGSGAKLKAGMVLAIEPMLATQTAKIKFLPDGFGIAMADGGLAGHFEKTVVVTADGCEILTP